MECDGHSEITPGLTSIPSRFAPLTGWNQAKVVFPFCLLHFPERFHPWGVSSNGSSVQTVPAVKKPDFLIQKTI
jgi:hypothetical protein